MRQELDQYQIDLIQTELNHRRQIRDQSLYRINTDQCSLSNIILLRGDEIWDKYRFKLEQSKLDLEQEKTPCLRNLF